ncbi:MAG: hypothetical protein WCJ92_08000 [Alphaproteobacteria bacterium]
MQRVLITIAQSNTEDALSSYWIENCNNIASRKTESENRTLAQLVKTTMKIHEAFKLDFDSYCNFPQYTVFQFYRYLKVADYYPSISDAEQAFSSVPAQRNLLHVLGSAIQMANIRRDIITSDLLHPLTTERTELQASEGLLSQNTASPNLLPLLEIADPIIPNGSAISTNSEEVDTATDPSEKLISVIDELWKLIDVQLQYKRRPFETVEMLIQQKSEK